MDSSTFSSETELQLPWPEIYDPDMPTALNELGLLKDDVRSELPQMAKSAYCCLEDHISQPNGAPWLPLPHDTHTHAEVVLPDRMGPTPIRDQGRLKSLMHELMPREGPDVSEWQAMRPFFESLYKRENVTLVETATVLKQKFGFEATTKMYKSRIKEWGLRKNLNANEKRKLAAAINHHTVNNESVPQLDIDSVRWRRVRRFCRQEEQFRGLANKMPAERGPNGLLLMKNLRAGPRRHSFPGKNARIHAQGRTTFTPHIQLSAGPGCSITLPNLERPLSGSSNLARVEIILLEAKCWTQRHIELEERCSPSPEDTHLWSPGIPKPFRINEADSELNTLLSNFEHGAELLARGETKFGWKALHNGCDLLSSVLSRQSIDLLRILLKISSDPQWARFPELRKRILRFVTKMSANQLGAYNPVTVILFHLLDEEVLSIAIRPILEVLIDLQSAFDAGNWKLAALKRNLVTFLTYNVNDLATAEVAATSNLKYCESIYGRVHRRTRRCILQLGAIYQASRQYRRAFETYRDVIDRDGVSAGHAALDWISITACRSLAVVYEAQGDVRGSADCWRVALSNTEMNYGLDTAASKAFVAKLKEAFGRRQGKDAELWHAARLNLDADRYRGPDCLDRFVRVRSMQSGRWLWCQGDDPRRVWDAGGSCHSTMRLAGVSPAIFPQRPEEEETSSPVVSGCQLLHRFDQAPLSG